MADTTREAVERLHRTVVKAWDRAGTLPAKASVKVVPSDWHDLRNQIEALKALLTERDAAQDEVARLTAALADAETRGAERMREAAAQVVHREWLDGQIDDQTEEELVDTIRALPLPPRERDGQEGQA